MRHALRSRREDREIFQDSTLARAVLTDQNHQAIQWNIHVGERLETRNLEQGEAVVVHEVLFCGANRFLDEDKLREILPDA